jgi:hypothetical protein
MGRLRRQKGNLREEGSIYDVPGTVQTADADPGNPGFGRTNLDGRVDSGWSMPLKELQPHGLA